MQSATRHTCIVDLDLVREHYGCIPAAPVRWRYMLKPGSRDQLGFKNGGQTLQICEENGILCIDGGLLSNRKYVKQFSTVVFTALYTQNHMTSLLPDQIGAYIKSRTDFRILRGSVHEDIMT